jgi:serine/threonine protein kinase
MPEELQKNMAISRYRIEHRLGEGGMGEVYLAKDTTLNRAVALRLSADE